MIRHLRFYLLTVLSAVCLGGNAFVGDTYKVVTSIDELKAGDEIAIASKTSGNALGASINGNSLCAIVPVTISDGTFEIVDGVAELTLEKDDNGWYFVNAYNQYLCSKQWYSMNYYSSKSNYATIAIDESGDYDATINFPQITGTNKIGQYETRGFGLYGVSSVTYNVQIYKKVHTRTVTSISFNGLTDKKIVLSNGTLDGKTFSGRTASETTGTVGKITYSAHGDGVATVDENTGAVTVNANVYGQTFITAKFTPTDETEYEASQTSYAIVNTCFSAYDDIASLRTDLNSGKLTPSDYHYINITFNNAKVLYKHEGTNAGAKVTEYFIREGEGTSSSAICLYNSGVTLENNSILNGTYQGIVYKYNGLLCLTQYEGYSSDITETPSTDEAEPLEITIDDAANHICDLVSIKGLTVTQKGTYVTKYLSDGTSTLVYDTQLVGYNQSLYSPFFGANLDMNSAIVIASTSYTGYGLAPVKANSVVYNFSESNTTTTVATQKYGVCVALKRTFAEGEWNTLCLPFALNSDQLKGMFGNDVQVRTLSAVNDNKLTFSKVTELAAEMPCLIKFGNVREDNTYTTTGVYLTAHTEGANKNTPTTDATSMVGIYQLTDVTTVAEGTALFLGDGNNFYQAKAGSQMKGFRAFFDVPAGGNANKVQAVIDGETTGINALNGDVVKQNGRVYNLNGQCVGTSLQQLQRGVYIQNGKKVIVK